MSDRDTFGKIGMVLATAGSAVGLGNIWRFPYMTGQDGGAAFILIYIGCVCLLGIPGMIGEFVVGRHAAANAAQAYRKLAPKGPLRYVGYLGMFTSTIILGFYSVVAGWCLQYLWASATIAIPEGTEAVKTYFDGFSASAFAPIVWTLAFVLITHWVIARGVTKGIEKVSNILMPTLFVLLLIIVGASCSLPGSGKGIEFLFKPDFSKLTSGVFLDALGQAFFSLSLGTACLCTYASYFSRTTNLMRSAFQIALIDTLVAILAGLMIFPAAFSVGVNPGSGPELIFITLPAVFQQAFSSAPLVGYIISVLFYALLVLAALTSTISMHEIGTAFFHEEMHITRHTAAWIVTAVAGVIAVLSSLSCGALDLTVLGKTFMNFCDFFTAQILLPIGALLTCVLLGWIVPRKVVRDEYTNGGSLRGRTFVVWIFLVRYVTPLCIIAIFLHQLGLF